MKKHSSFIFILLLFIFTIGIIKYSPTISYPKKKNILYENAKVISISEENLQEDPLFPNLYKGYQNVQIQILTGTYKNEKYNIKNSMSRLYNVKVKEGMTVIAALYFKDDNLINIGLEAYKTEGLIYVLISAFFLILIIIGGKKGINSIISLIFTGIIIIYYLIPSIFNGTSPIFAAIITVTIVTVISLLLIGGPNKKTFSAMMGTILGVIIAGIIAHISGRVAHLSGLTMQDAYSLIYVAEQYKINIQGLMFVAILIASLGAIMDVGMSIASSVFEMHKVNPSLKTKELFTSGMNVGKDVIGTMSNTLILAFVGSSLNLIIFIVAANMSYTQLINLDVITIEVIQGIAGSIGIIITVPLTALISVFFIKKS